MVLRLIVVSTALVVAVHGYGSGAPETACATLQPKHPGSQGINGVPPYDFSVNTPNSGPGGQIKVRISQSGNGPNLQGFFLQARKKGSSKPAGKWVPVDGTSKTVNCDGIEGSSLTHVNKKDKQQIEATWIAPGPGEYEIL